MIEDLVYNSTFDHIIRQVMRNNATGNGNAMVLEVLNTSPIKDSMSEIQTALASERPSAAPASAAPSSSSTPAGLTTTLTAQITGEVSVVQVVGKEV